MSGLAVALFLFVFSAVATPGLVTSLLMPLLLLILFVLATRWFTKRPLHVLALPVIAIGAWFLVMLV